MGGINIHMRNTNNIFKKIFRNKTRQILACLTICFILILLNIMLVTDIYSFGNFLTLVFMLFLCFILLDIIFVILKAVDKKYNFFITKKVKLIFEQIKSGFKDYQSGLKAYYQKQEKYFQSKSGMILYNTGIYTWTISYIVMFDKLKITYHVVYWCTYVLFMLIYKFMLCIIYKKDTQEGVNKNNE